MHGLQAHPCIAACWPSFASPELPLVCCCCCLGKGVLQTLTALAYACCALHCIVCDIVQGNATYTLIRLERLYQIITSACNWVAAALFLC
jgi:hypothetical protein